MNSDHEYDSIMRRGDATEPQIPDGITFKEILLNCLDAISGFSACAANIHDRNFYNPDRQHKHKRNSKSKHKRNSKRNKFSFKRR